MDDPSAGTDFRAALPMLLMVAAIFFLNFTSRIMLSPLLHALEADFGITHAQAGGLFLFISAGYFISLASAGLLACRITHRSVITSSAVLVGLSLAAASQCGELNAMRAGLFVMGLAAGVYLPSGISTLISLVDSRHWGRAMGVHELAPNLAFMAAPLAAGALLPLMGWRSLLLMVGASSAVMGGLFWIVGRGGRFKGEPPRHELLSQIVSRPDFWIVTGLFVLGISSTVGIYSMLPLHLVATHGMDPVHANHLVGLSRAPTLATALGAGWLTDRLGPSRTMTLLFVCTGVFTALLGLSSGPLLTAAVFLQPLTAVAFFPAGFVALHRIGPPEAKNLTVSLAVPLGFLLGGGGLPALLGVLGGQGGFGMGFILAGGLMCLGAVGARFLKLRGG